MTLVNGGVSFWMQHQPDQPARPPVEAHDRADVVIVGAGMSGLWTAYHLAQARPDWRILVLEAERVGWGASGRNGGWLSQLIPGDRGRYAAGPAGPDGVARLQAAMLDGITDVVRIAADHGLDIDAHRGGNLVVATSRAAAGRLEARMAADLHHGLPPSGVQRLDAEATRARIGVAPAVAGLYYPDVTRINPAKLVHGLARVVEERGVVIHEGSRVTALEPGRVRVAAGGREHEVTAPVVLLTTEGYSGPLVGARRIVPVNSSMIATRVLTDDEWDGIGWSDRECLSDAAHTFIYAQRTADGRIAIGGRGSPYRFRSNPGSDGVTPTSTVDLLTARLKEYFPHLDLEPEYAWSGVLGVTRDWCTSVQFDSATGVGSSTGYAGHGVTTAYAATKSLALLVLGQDSASTRLPWVGYRSPNWEPEPLRWLGIHSMYRLFRVADWWEEHRDLERTSWIGRAAGRLAGLHP